jgi:hypothetical protein
LRVAAGALRLGQGAAAGSVPARGCHVLGLVVALLAALALAGAASTSQAPPAWADPASPAPAGPGISCPPEASAPPSDASNGALLDKLVPGQSAADRPGCFPTSAYRIDFHQGNILSTPDNTMGWFTDFLFGFTRVLVAVGLWVVEWVFTFGFAARLAQPAADIAARYQSNVAAPLVSFVLTLAAVYGGFHIFRGRLGKGVGEFGLSLFIVAFFAAFIISQPKTFLDNALKTTGALSGSVVSLAVNCGSGCDTVQLGRCPAGSGDPSCTVPADNVSGSPDPSTNPNAYGPPVPGSDRAEFVFDQYRGLIRPLERGIHQAFIEQPYQLLQWGQTVPGGECTHRMNEILAQSPGGDRNKIIHIMKNGALGKDDGGVLAQLNPVKTLSDALFGGSDDFDGNCDALYKFNRQPSMERLGVAAMSLFAAAIIIVLLVLVAGTVVAAQLVAVVLIALTPFAALGGALPGAGRQVLWRWVASFARALLAILLMSSFLAFLLVTSKAVFDTTVNDSLLVRMVALNLVTIVAFVARKKMLAAGHRVATNFGQRLGSASIGGHKASWMAPAAAGGATGFAFAQHLRDVTADGHQVTGPLGRAMTRRFHNRQQGQAFARAMGAAGVAGGDTYNTGDTFNTTGHTFNDTTFNAHFYDYWRERHHRDGDENDDIVDAEVVDDRELDPVPV